jgi:nicotinate phosphoribosyltransferase
LNSFHTASTKEIKQGHTTDIYFKRTKKILRAKGKDNVKVSAEITSGSIPDNQSWGILCGVEEVALLFEGHDVDVYAMSEGSIFHAKDNQGVRSPILTIDGVYHDFCEYESPLLGFLCQESAVASRAARIRLAAGDKPAIAFGARRIHPSIVPAVDRAAFIGGLDGVSSIKGAETVGVPPTGTIPHALMIIFEDQIKAWKAFDEVIEPEVPRIILVDTFYDEKTEAIMAAETLSGKLSGVRIDTPKSRRGDLSEIIKEVRWELDLRGHNDVKIFVSGGLDERTTKVYNEAGADAFGVGTWVSGAPTFDFAMDIVELEGRAVAKRGKLGGRKQVWRCTECLKDLVLPIDKKAPKCDKCGRKTEPMLKPLVVKGNIKCDFPEPKEIRDYVLSQLKKI